MQIKVSHLRTIFLVIVVIILGLWFSSSESEEIQPRNSRDLWNMEHDEDGRRSKISETSRREYRKENVTAAADSGTPRRADETDKRSLPESSESSVLVRVVQASDAAPIAGAEVAVTNPRTGTEYMKLRTDARGTATLSLEPGQYYFVASHAEYHKNGGKFDLATPVGSLVHTISLKQKLFVRGRVTDDFGKPITGAQVRFNGEHAGFRAETDSDGHFECGILAGEYRVLVDKYPHKTWMDDLYITNKTFIEVKLESVRSGLLAGSVTDDSSRPVKGAKVSLMRKIFSSEILETSTFTDSAGYYELEFAPEGDKYLRVEATPYQSEEIDVACNGPQERILFQLEKYPTFEVVVTGPHGRRIDSAMVLGYSLEDKDRRVCFPGGDSGLYYSTEFPFLMHATAIHEGLGIAVPEMIEQYSPVIEVDIPKGGELRGRFWESNGSILKAADVRIEGPGGLRYFDPVVSHDGSFSFENLPAGPYTVCVHSRQYQRLCRDVAIEVGEISVAEFKLERLIEADQKGR